MIEIHCDGCGRSIKAEFMFLNKWKKYFFEVRILKNEWNIIDYKIYCPDCAKKEGG